ncbi:phage/plasmid replication domain-containing protein [Viscerimonas tarda]
MYDTVNFWLNRVEAGSDLEKSTQYLKNPKETVNKDTGEFWSVGNLDNLKVTVSMAGVSIKGSLAKFLFPDNTYTLNRNQVKEAIAKLSDSIHLDLLRACVTRIDVSTNFIMKHPANGYYDVLGLCRNFNRVQATNNTLYYHNKGKEQKRALIFYDKAREVSSRNGVMPDVFSGSNLLRYEARWNTRLPQQLKEPEIKGNTLFDAKFYGKVISLWADGYFNIDKKRTPNFEAMEKIKTVSDATDFVCAIALHKLTPDEVQSILEDMKQNKVFEDRKYYTRLKAKLKEISNKADITKADDLVTELDSEIRNILSYKR